MIGVVTMISNGLTFPFVPLYVTQEFTASMLLVELVVSGYFLLRIFSELPFGVTSDRIGPQKPLLFGKILAIVAPFSCWVATDVYQLVAARAMWGMGDAAYFCVSTVYVASIFSERDRGKAIGMFTAVEWGGNLLGQSLSGFVSPSFGIRNTYLISTVLSVVALILLALMRFQKDPLSIPSGRSILPSWSTMRSAVNISVLIACIVIFFTMLRNNGVISEIFPIYVMEELGASPTEYGLLTATSTGGAVLGMSLGGLISDRFGRKRTLVLGFGIGVADTYLLTVNNLLVLFPIMGMNGLFWGIAYSVTPALVADSVTNNVRGIAIGIFRTFFDLGGLTGPIILSAVAEAIGLPYGYIITFYIATALMFVNILIVLLLKTKRALPT